MMNCRHMMVSMFGDRTICLMCKADLKFNKETKAHEVVDKPEQPEFHDKLADRLQEMIVDAVKPLGTKAKGE
jgi:hypothetical protein